MDPSQSGQSNIVVKELIFLLGGFVVGYGMATSYFQYLAPKLEPVIVEKVVTKLVEAPVAPVKQMPPARSYNFHTLQTVDANGATTTLTGEDASTTESILTALKKDKQFPVALFPINSSLLNGSIVSGGYMVLTLVIPKEGGGVVNYVIDIMNKRILDTFGGKENYHQDGGTIVTGADVNGISYYMYGASTSVQLPNSILDGNQSYFSSKGEQGEGHFEIIATTTNSITLGIFDKKQEESKSEDGTIHYKKVGERMFIIE